MTPRLSERGASSRRREREAQGLWLAGNVSSAGSVSKDRMTSVGSVEVLDQRPTGSHHSPVPVSSLIPRSNVPSPSTSQHAFRLTPHESSLCPPRLKCSAINPTCLPGESMPSALISSFERIFIIFRGRILLLRSILQSMKGMRIVVEEPTSIHAEFTSGLKWSLFCGNGSRQAPTSY